MKRILFLLITAFLFTLPYSMEAQKGKEGQRKFNKEAFIAKRNAYIVEKAKLSKDEADKFLPLFNELQDKKFEAGLECRRQQRMVRNKNKASEKEFEGLIYCHIDARKKEADLEREYTGKFLKILSAEKVFRCQQAEMHYAREFMRGGHRK